MSDAAVDRVAFPLPAKSPPKAVRKSLMLAGLAFLVAVAAVWYGYRWWTVGTLYRKH
jgi:multidrug resistance efflux pump